MPMWRSLPLARSTSMRLGKSSRASILDARETEARTGPQQEELRAIGGSPTLPPCGDHGVATARPRRHEVKKGGLCAPLFYPPRLAGPDTDFYRNRVAA
jgi:hypothetical protein